MSKLKRWGITVLLTSCIGGGMNLSRQVQSLESSNSTPNAIAEAEAIPSLNDVSEPDVIPVLDAPFEAEDSLTQEQSGIPEENSERGESPTLEDDPEPTPFTPALSPQYPPPELNWLAPGAVPPDDITTSATISLSGLTPPSLWWTAQQFGGKTLDGWIAYPGTETLPPRVDLVVNRQLWGLSDYLERYSFVHRFGRAAQSFGYTIRVFNDVGEPLAIYPCPINPCSIIFNSSGIGVLRDNDPFSSF